MASTTQKKYHCMQCELTEEKCDCEKYCCLCQGQVGIRLCQDGHCLGDAGKRAGRHDQPGFPESALGLVSEPLSTPVPPPEIGRQARTKTLAGM